MQEAFTVDRVGAKVNRDTRAGNLGRGRRAGHRYGRSYGNVRGLMDSGERAADGQGGIQINRAFTRALEVKEANTGRWRRDETQGDLPVPPSEGKGNEVGRAMSSRSVVIVPMKQGNRTEGTLT
jgi:hypothetical protein